METPPPDDTSNSSDRHRLVRTPESVQESADALSKPLTAKFHSIEESPKTLVSPFVDPNLRKRLSLAPIPRQSHGQSPSQHEDHHTIVNHDHLSENITTSTGSLVGDVRRLLGRQWQSELSETLDGDNLLVEAQQRYIIQSERVSNFFAIPLEVERFMWFGYLICLDSFLWLFTSLPLRCLRSLSRLFKLRSLSMGQRFDLVRMLMFVLCCYFFMWMDASRLYHSIRGQAVIKLYVIFNVLEIGDRLFCSFGQDLLDSFFSKYALSQTAVTTTIRKESSLNPYLHFLLAIVYICAHTLIMLYQVITLNVAINSHNNSLFTLLVSNQFVEIKGSVFKRFEKENLFQISCSDIVERFQLSIYLLIISSRNFLEIGGEMHSMESSVDLSYLLSLPAHFVTYLFTLISESDSIQSAFISLSLGLFSIIFHSIPNAIYDTLLQPFTMQLDFDTYVTIIQVIVIPVITVFFTEMIVDWLKHAFVTKFNQIRPRVYSKFLDVLCKDFFDEKLAVKKNSVVVSKRLGFASMPLAVLSVCIFLQNISMISWLTFPLTFDVASYGDLSRGRMVWLLLKVLLGWSTLFATLIMFKSLTAELLLNIARKRTLAVMKENAESYQNVPSSAPIPSPSSITSFRDRQPTADSFQQNSLSKSSTIEHRRSEESFLVTTNDKRLEKADEELIGDIKMPHPEGKISLDNIDRYTLFKGRIP